MEIENRAILADKSKSEISSNKIVKLENEPNKEQREEMVTSPENKNATK